MRFVYVHKAMREVCVNKWDLFMYIKQLCVNKWDLFMYIKQRGKLNKWDLFT